MAGRLSMRIVSPLAVAGLIGWLAAAPAATAGAAAGPGPLGAAFQAAAQRENVPEDLLLAVSYLRTGWNASYQADESGVASYGPMALSAGKNGHGTLAQAAADLGLPASQLETDPAANVMGGAAVLADDAKATDGKKAATLGQWYGALADFTGISYYEPAKQFADSVYALLAQGVTAAATDGEQLSVTAQQASPDTSEIDVLNLTHLQPQQSDYPGNTVFIPGGGTGFGGSNRPKNGLFLGYVVVHDTEEDYPGTVRSFTEPGDCCSAHYVVDGQDNAPVSYPPVTQFVHNHDISFHAGNFWFNQHSIGIENVGFADHPAGYFTQQLYDTSARLVAYTAAVYGIPLDRAHLIEHGNVPGPSDVFTHGMHWDNGTFWDWPYYLSRIDYYYGQLTGGAAPPAPTVPSQYAQPRPQIRMISVNSQYGAAADIPAWESSQHLDYTGVYTQPGGSQLVLGASSPATWTSPSSFNARDFSCDNLPDATQQANGTWIEDPHSDLRAKADWGDAFALLDQQTVNGVTWDKIDFNGTPGWVRDSGTSNGWGVTVTFTGGSQPTDIYGQPTLSSSHVICSDSASGFSRAGQSYVSQHVYTDPATGITWYQIFYNHRLAWVPASEVTTS
jgi:hypothetical protein